MFRAAQANPFDDPVGKATDENLTSENWEYILDVCDRVNSSETGAKDAVGSLIKRLAHRNANVQLYTLELANALSQNCKKTWQELASRSFTDALLRLANDRNTHTQVKAKILERMEEWTEMFSSNADFGIMEQAYYKLKTSNPNLQAPTKPFKKEITDTDRRKEEEELQMALALSVQDSKAPGESSSTGRTKDDDKPAESSSASQQQQQQSQFTYQPAHQGTTAATVSRVKALYDFIPSEAGELQFKKGDIIAVLESVYKDWWRGSLRGQTGIFPLNYVEKLQDPTQEELQRDAQTEAEVFAEIKNVEKLLTLLSTSSNGSNVQDNEEITELYNSTLAIRPKLIDLIRKYSQKKDDFDQLNEKFIKARMDYEALIEASLSSARPHQPAYMANRPGPTGYPPQQQPAPQAGGYGYPPPNANGPGYLAPLPQEQDPSRFYNAQGPPAAQPSTAPQPANATAASPPYPASAHPDRQHPSNGPAPFYMIPPGQARPQAPASTAPPGVPDGVAAPPGRMPPTKPMSPAPSQQPGAPGAVPPQRQSMYSTHELAANPGFESPANERQSFYGGNGPAPQPGYDNRASSVYSSEAPITTATGGYAPSAPPPGTGYSGQGPPGAAYMGGNDMPAPLHVQHQQSQQQYKPYTPPPQQMGRPLPGMAPAGGGGYGGGERDQDDVSDYYR